MNRATDKGHHSWWEPEAREVWEDWNDGERKQSHENTVTDIGILLIPRNLEGKPQLVMSTILLLYLSLRNDHRVSGV